MYDGFKTEIVLFERRRKAATVVHYDDNDGTVIGQLSVGIFVQHCARQERREEDVLKSIRIYKKIRRKT